MSVMLRRLWVQLSADRKRFGVLCVALAVGLLFWARLIVISDTPRTAVAEPDDETAPATSLGLPDSASTDNRDDRPLVITLDRVPGRDPFQISEQHFPNPKPLDALAPEVGKSRTEPAEDPQQVELRRMAHLRSLVDQLTLEAVMSDPPMAVINTRLFRVGDSVPGPEPGSIRFQLITVQEQSVVLEYEDRQFELRMTIPGG